jgi:hypothetical protein
MFTLFFFNGDDPDIAYKIKDKKAKYGIEYVKEKEFNTIEEANYRLDNIGSRWYFYPNACIIDDEDVVSIYMWDGYVYISKRIEEL